MFLSVNKLPNVIPQGDKPNPKAAQALQEGLGGQFGEMRTMMQYLFQNMNFRGDATAYKDLPDAPQEFASGLYTDLRKLAQQVKVRKNLRMNKRYK